MAPAWTCLFAQLCEQRRSKDARRASGSFFTPRWLGRTTAALCLDPLLDVWCAAGADPTALPRYVRVLDETVGCGQLLYQAAEHIAHRAGPGCLFTVVTACLYGQDVDPDAVSLARLALALLCPPEARTAAAIALERNLTVGDSLQTPRTDVRPTVYLGNPPWQRLRTRTADGPWLRCRALDGPRRNLWHFFVENLPRRTSPGGRFACILPERALADPLVRSLCLGPQAALTLECVWRLPPRSVWTDVLSSGVVVLVGSTAVVRPADYVVRRGPSATAWMVVAPAMAEACAHLCPTPLVAYARTVGRDRCVPYGQAGGVCASPGPRLTKRRVSPAPQCALRVDGGCRFRLPYVYDDDIACLPRRGRDAYVMSHAHWLCSAERPDAIATMAASRLGEKNGAPGECERPSVLSGERQAAAHGLSPAAGARGRPPGVRALGGQRGPRGMATTIPRASDPWGTDFLLGFWNSAVAAELVVDGGRGDWLAPQDLSRMPFPRGVDLRGLRALAATPTAQEMERDPGRVDPSACPSHMLPLLVAFAARGAEEAMTEAVRACDVWYRGGGQRAADRKQCWQWIVHGQGPPPPPEIAQPLHRCGVHRAIVDASLRRIYGLLTG